MKIGKPSYRCLADLVKFLDLIVYKFCSTSLETQVGKRSPRTYQFKKEKATFLIPN